MSRMVAVDKEQNLVFSVRSWYGMMGARRLTMIRRGGTKLCSIAIIVGLRPPLKTVWNARLSSSEEDVIELKW